MNRIEVVAAIILKEDQIFATKRGYGEFEGGWEFPGGKMEVGETPKQALIREIREELAVEIQVLDHVYTVEYDYPKFHLTMHCYFSKIEKGELRLLEHTDAKWLSKDELDSVEWLPADIEVVECLKKRSLCI